MLFGRFEKGHVAWNKGKKYPQVTGEKHPFWKGKEAGYCSIHRWVARHLGRPNICSDCGTKIAKRYEWANISKKYFRDSIDWKRLCSKCHKSFDQETVPKGSKVGTSKLKENQILEIRKLYFDKKLNQCQLATEFNTVQTNISLIVNRITWKHI
jgi:hypothetical protein